MKWRTVINSWTCEKVVEQQNRMYSKMEISQLLSSSAAFKCLLPTEVPIQLCLELDSVACCPGKT